MAEAQLLRGELEDRNRRLHDQIFAGRSTLGNILRQTGKLTSGWDSTTCPEVAQPVELLSHDLKIPSLIFNSGGTFVRCGCLANISFQFR